MKPLRVSMVVIIFSVLFSLAQVANAEVEFVSLHNFAVNGSNGVLPRTGLTLGADGNIYGTTGGVRMNGSGRRIRPTVFKILPSGEITPIAWFDDEGNFPNGKTIRDENLDSELLIGRDRNLYGVTREGGPSGYGRVFSMTTDGRVKTLHAFVGYFGTNGWGPAGGLVEGTDGWFYGTAYNGGIKERTDNVGMGTIYKVNKNGEMQSLFFFKGTNGEFPACRLVFGKDGCLYGTTPYGGPAYAKGPPEHGDGTVFRITINGSLTRLFSFSGTNGSRPYASLSLASDGNLFGTTTWGGRFGCGTVFRITPEGGFSSLWSFNGTNGAMPETLLLKGADGNLYGTTRSGGIGFKGLPTSGNGTIFQISTNGKFTSLFSFGGTNGANPHCALVQTKDGSFWGTTERGGPSFGDHDDGAGTIFQFMVNN